MILPSVEYVAAVLALALLTVLPGPDVAVVTRVALSRGRSAAFRTSLGIVCGLAVWGVLTVAGLAAVLAASAEAYTVVRVAGALYLVALGVVTLVRRTPAGEHVTAPPTRGAWRTGFVSNMLNPKIALFYTGVLPGLVPTDADVPHALLLASLVLVHVVVTLAWLAAYAAMVDRAARVVRRPSVRRALDRVTGVVLVAFGLRVAAG